MDARMNENKPQFLSKFTKGHKESILREKQLQHSQQQLQPQRHRSTPGQLRHQHCTSSRKNVSQSLTHSFSDIHTLSLTLTKNTKCVLYTGWLVGLLMCQLVGRSVGWLVFTTATHDTRNMDLICMTTTTNHNDHCHHRRQQQQQQ